MNKSLMGALIVVGLVLVVGVFYFLRQPENQEDVLPSSVTQGINQELSEGETIGGSDAELEQDLGSLLSEESSIAPSSSPNFFVAEEAELNSEIVSLQKDVDQLSSQEYETDMNNLEQIQQ